MHYPDIALPDRPEAAEIDRGTRPAGPIIGRGGCGQRPAGWRDRSGEQDLTSSRKRIRRILVPTDFSPASLAAVEQGVQMANQCNAELTILHVIDVNVQVATAEAGGAHGAVKRLWDDGWAQLSRLASTLCGQVQAQATIEEGLPWEEILGRSGEFDLLILGESRVKNGWKLFSRRTVQRVIEGAACPVMLVRSEAAGRS
jgi:nucleotide-binding universal stress UspA family protein